MSLKNTKLVDVEMRERDAVLTAAVLLVGSFIFVLWTFFDRMILTSQDLINTYFYTRLVIASWATAIAVSILRSKVVGDVEKFASLLPFSLFAGYQLSTSNDLTISPYVAETVLIYFCIGAFIYWKFAHFVAYSFIFSLISGLMLINNSSSEFVQKMGVLGIVTSVTISLVAAFLKGYDFRLLVRKNVENKKLLEDLQKSQTEVIISSRNHLTGQIAASVAHEINNPLSIVTGFVDIIDKKSSGKYSNEVSKIQSASSRIAKVVNLLRNIAPKSSDNHDMSFDIKEVGDSVVLFLFNEFQENKISLINEIEKNHIVGDFAKISSILMHLLKNSLESVSDRPNAWVKIYTERHDDDFVDLVVEDSGKPLSDDVAGSLFKLFYSTKNASSGEVRGVGLCTSKSICLSSGGDLFYDTNCKTHVRFVARLKTLRKDGV